MMCMISIVLTCCFICCVHVALGLVQRDREEEASRYATGDFAVRIGSSLTVTWPLRLWLLLM
jgi:hypothetical protein